jgi:hypothetical protein
VITVPVKILLTSEVRAETREEAREQAKRWLALIPYLLLLSPLPTDITLGGRPRATRLRRVMRRRRARSQAKASGMPGTSGASQTVSAGTMAVSPNRSPAETSA